MHWTDGRTLDEQQGDGRWDERVGRAEQQAPSNVAGDIAWTSACAIRAAD